MPRPASQSKDWDFKVAPTRMSLPDGRPSNLFANVRSDNGYVLGAISEKGYGLVQNSDFVSTIRDALSALGLDGYSEDITATQQGRRLYATYTFNNRVHNINKVNDKVGLRLRFTNSFDCGLSASGELMALVLRCLNGAMLEKGEFSLSERHSAKINLAFVKEVIGRAVGNFEASLALFDAMADVQVTDEQGVTILDNLPLSEKTRVGIADIWLNPNFVQTRARSLYALYDATTEYLRDQESNRLEFAAKINRTVLRNLAKALNPTVFAGLIVKSIEVEAVEISEPEAAE